MSNYDDELRDLLNSKDIENNDDSATSTGNDDTKHRTSTDDVDGYDERKENDESTKSQQKSLMEIANDNIEILFKESI